jgi:tRNA 2-thiouridine synthesizing protein C
LSSGKLLIISTHAPYFSNHAQEAIEAALGASNTGLQLSFVLLEEGIYQLNKNADSKLQKRKSVYKQLKAFELYDIEELYAVIPASENSLAHHIIESQSLAKAISQDTFEELLKGSTHVLCF